MVEQRTHSATRERYGKSSNISIANPQTYMIECHKCKKQYIGETKRTLRERFTEHRQATNNPSHANATAAVPRHFNLPDHSIKDMKLIPFELQPTSLCTAVPLPSKKIGEGFF